MAERRGDREEAARIGDEETARNPHSVVLRTWLGVRAITNEEYVDARAIFRELVEEDRRMPPSLGHRKDMLRSISMNNLAWCDLMLDDPALVEEALEMSAGATGLLPEHPAVRGTRAFALILGGRSAEGLDLGLAAYRKTKEAGPKALQACVLAIGYARHWRFGQAARWLDIARRADPSCPLLGRASGELEALRAR